MTSRDSGRSFRQGRASQSLDREMREDAVKGLDLRHALERYGLMFNRQGAALCPFHSEKTASFRIRGRFWHCFGCGESGELVKFVRKKFNLSYPEALDAICRDFGLNSAKPTIADLERIDYLRLARYNQNIRYKQLLRDLDWYTQMYWLAYDLHEYAIRFCGGKSIENEIYVSAHFALMSAQKALEQAEYDCSQFIRENPQAIIKPTQQPSDVRRKRSLPPAPKWG